MSTPHNARTPSNAHTPAPELGDDAVNLPLPNTFDFIPPLHALLSRLLLPPLGLQSSSAHGPTLDGAIGAAATTDGIGAAGPGDDAAVLSGSGYLEIQQLGPASSAIKNKIQKARNAVKELPDVDRTIEEQEEEMKFLEDRIAKMRTILGNVGMARDEDVNMDDT